MLVFFLCPFLSSSYYLFKSSNFIIIIIIIVVNITITIILVGKSSRGEFQARNSSGMVYLYSSREVVNKPFQRGIKNSHSI